MALCYTGDCGEYAVAPMLVRAGSPTRCCEDPPMCYPCLPRCRKPEVVYCCEKPRSRSPPPLTCRHCCDEFRHQHSCHRELIPARCCRKSLPCAAPCPPPDCCPVCSHTDCSPVRTKYVIPCYRYEDGRIVRKLPVTAFKRNGMQDQEHSGLGTANFLTRCAQDVSIECDVCVKPIKVCDPCKDNQPTVLMRRACEVAVGVRPRREPFVKSTHSACNDHEGNCCYHFEKKKHRSSTDCCPYAPVKQQRGICHPSSQCCQYEYEDCVFASPCQPAKYYLHYHY